MSQDYGRDPERQAQGELCEDPGCHLGIQSAQAARKVL